ncbi:hypothetical protein ABT168_24585 [Streptomyces sp. NPDC001793]|uniref:hypothetical protein n=1 Tax=Streptomyces sp. NPDC001793 TaxID=3154657 RepID=UPI00332CB742
MTTTPRTAPIPVPRIPPAVLRTVALAACVPYLTLKVIWLSGGRLGIPVHSPLRQDGDSLMALNGLTVAMDAAVIVLAFLLTRPWGGRVPAWLLAVPMWCATGLLAPIVVVFPAQAVAGALVGRTGAVSGGGPDALLEPWVWTVVYTGFIVQALALGTLFVRYARHRWGHLWRGPLAGLPDSPLRPARRLTAGAVTVLSALPAAMHLLWAAGSCVGLSPVRVADRDLDARLNDVGFVLFASVTVVGVLLLALGGGPRRRGGRLPLLVPLTAAWLGSGALACWGGWLALTGLPVPAGDPRQPAPLMSLTYAVQMIVGVVVAAAGAHFFAERAAGCAAPGQAGDRSGAVRCG